MLNLIDQPTAIKPQVATKPRMGGNTSIPWIVEGCELPEGHPLSPSDWKFEISADVSLGDPGRLSGHPDSWYPPEAGECDIVDVMLYVDPANVLPPSSIAEAERLFREMISNDRKLSEMIEDALYEEAGRNRGPDPDVLYDRWKDEGRFGAA